MPTTHCETHQKEEETITSVHEDHADGELVTTEAALQRGGWIHTGIPQTEEKACSLTRPQGRLIGTER